MAKEEIKVEPIEPLIRTASVSTQHDLAEPVGTPELGILSQIKEILNAYDIWARHLPKK